MYYVVQVQGGYEEKVIKSIHERVDHSIYVEAFTPSREMLRKFNGEYVKTLTKVFPGYIFIDSNNPIDLSTSLLRLPEFAKMLGKDSVAHSFIPLSETESRTIDLLCGRESKYTIAISEVLIKEGKIARVCSGPLQGLEGCIKKVNLHKRQVTIAIEMFNEIQEVVLGIEFISIYDPKEK